MSWKSIEMQVALPRTVEAGRVQEQLQRQGQAFQDTLSHNQIQEDQLKRQRLEEPDVTYKLRNNDKDENNDENNAGQQNSNEKKQKEQKVQHPFLGSKIDFSG